MSFLVAGRNKNALRLARRNLVQLKATAELLGLCDLEAWRSDFSLGYLYRHSYLGLEQAKDEHWSSWFQRDYPDEDLARTVFLDMAPPVFSIDREWLAVRYDELTGDMAWNDDPFSESQCDFVQGVAWGDRTLHSYLRDVSLDDAVGIQVQGIEKRYHKQFGTRLGNLVGFRRPRHYYSFLVAHTLGPNAFDKTFSDVELARLLNKKSI